MRTVRYLLIAILAFAAVDTAVFRTGFYTSILNPDSSTGLFERFLYIEQHRKKDGPQVLVIGNSRMGVMPRVTDPLKAEVGATFGTVAVAGTTPRCWYYMLRDADPDANRYSAILIGLDDYNDAESWEDMEDRTLDIRFLVERLRMSDLLEFPGSFRTYAAKWEALRAILFKGSALGADFQDFLLNPAKRFAYVDQVRRDAPLWHYEYIAPSTTMEGVEVDWKTRTVTAPADRTAAQKEEYWLNLARVLPPSPGEDSIYMHRWLGRIYEHYRGSHTKLIFVRVPRGPLVRPDLPPTNPHSSVRELASHPEVRLIDEHRLDFLEHPNLFQDEVHLNQPGLDQFSATVAREVGAILRVQ